MKIPGQPERTDKKPVQDQKKSIGRFDLLRGQESKDRNFLESESDESDTEDEEEESFVNKESYSTYLSRTPGQPENEE